MLDAQPHLRIADSKTSIISGLLNDKVSNVIAQSPLNLAPQLPQQVGPIKRFDNDFLTAVYILGNVGVMKFLYF